MRRARAPASSVGRRADRGQWRSGFVSPPLKVWIAGARPRTLPAAVVPVFVGTAAGYWSSGRLLVDHDMPRHVAQCTSLDHQVSWPNAFLALVVALGIQIGTNYVNDYADGQRGTDEHRAGPVRLVAGGLATVREVKIAAAASFAVAAIAGLVLAARVTWWFIPLGARLLRGRLGLHRGPQALRLLRVRRALRLRVLRVWSRRRAPPTSSTHRSSGSCPATSSSFRPSTGGSRCGPASRSDCWRRRCSRRTTCATSRPTPSRASGRWRCASGAVAPACSTASRLMGVALSIGVLYGYRPWALLALLATPLAILPIRLALSDRERSRPPADARRRRRASRSRWARSSPSGCLV